MTRKISSVTRLCSYLNVLIYILSDNLISITVQTEFSRIYVIKKNRNCFASNFSRESFQYAEQIVDLHDVRRDFKQIP